MWSRYSTGLSLKYFVVALCAVALLGCGKLYPQQSEALPNEFKLPPGTEIQVRLVSDVPYSTQPGIDFAGTLAAPLYYKRQLVDPQGNLYDREVEVAPEGAVVEGKVVTDEGSPLVERPQNTPRTALRLTMVSIFGGKEFNIVTDPVSSGRASTESNRMSHPRKGDVVTFKLAEPATMAMVVDSGPDRNVERRG